MYGGGEGGKNFFFKMCALPLSIGAEFYCTTVKDHLIFLLSLYSMDPDPDWTMVRMLELCCIMFHVGYI